MIIGLTVWLVHPGVAHGLYSFVWIVKREGFQCTQATSGTACQSGWLQKYIFGVLFNRVLSLVQGQDKPKQADSYRTGCGWSLTTDLIQPYCGHYELGEFLESLMEILTVRAFKVRVSFLNTRKGAP